MSEGAGSPPPGGSPGPSSSNTEHQVRLDQRSFMIIMIWMSKLSVLAIYFFAECGHLFEIHYQINQNVKDWIHKSLIAGGWGPRKGKRQQGQGWGEGGYSIAGQFFFYLAYPFFPPNRLTFLLPLFSFYHHFDVSPCYKSTSLLIPFEADDQGKCPKCLLDDCWSTKIAWSWQSQSFAAHDNNFLFIFSSQKGNTFRSNLFRQGKLPDKLWKEKW